VRHVGMCHVTGQFSEFQKDRFVHGSSKACGVRESEHPEQAQYRDVGHRIVVV
jgi:hypothetical protein